MTHRKSIQKICNISRIDKGRQIFSQFKRNIFSNYCTIETKENTEEPNLQNDATIY